MCRELHEPSYARGRSVSQQKKSSLNHFFIHRVLHSSAHDPAARESRRIVFHGVFRFGKCAAARQLWKTNGFEWANQNHELGLN
jgi:hypothetical protein